MGQRVHAVLVPFDGNLEPIVVPDLDVAIEPVAGMTVVVMTRGNRRIIARYKYDDGSAVVLGPGDTLYRVAELGVPFDVEDIDPDLSGNPPPDLPTSADGPSDADALRFLAESAAAMAEALGRMADTLAMIDGRLVELLTQQAVRG